MDITKTLLLTPHGSHLYGLNHAGSDMDYYRVVATQPVPNENGHVRKKNAVQTIESGEDETVFDLKTFCIHAFNGVPQSLEAMFSPMAEVDVLKAYRAGFRVSVQSQSARYIHAIEKFSVFSFKKRRHALRYALNLNESIANNGRFNPVLTENDKTMISEMAMSKDYISHLRRFSFFELNLDEEKILESLREDNQK